MSASQVTNDMLGQIEAAGGQASPQTVLLLVEEIRRLRGDYIAEPTRDPEP